MINFSAFLAESAQKNRITENDVKDLEKLGCKIVKKDLDGLKQTLTVGVPSITSSGANKKTTYTNETFHTRGVVRKLISDME